MTLDTWKRQKDESAKAYQAALMYFEMGAERSLEAVGRKLEKSWRFLGRWSSRFNWVSRAADYDTHESVNRQIAIDKATADEATKWAKRQAQIREDGFSTYLALKAKADLMLQFPLKTEKLSTDGKTVIIEPAEWSFNTAVRMQETALKLGRLSAELSTENVDVRQIPWNDLNPNELERIGAGEQVSAVLCDYRDRKAKAG